MNGKLLGLLKMSLYTLRSGRRIRFGGLPFMEGSSRIKLLQGTARFGSGFRMKPGAYCAIVNGGSLSVGTGVSINRNAMVICHDSVTIGDHCSIAPNVLIYDHDHNFGPDGLSEGYHTTPVVIEENCWIGAGVIILRGAHVGKGSVIGAGCVVQGSIPPHSVVKSDRSLMIQPIGNNNKD